MNTRSILLALCVTASSAMFAQTPVQVPPNSAVVDRGQAHHDNMVKELGLTPEQDQQLLQIEEQHKQSAKELNRANLDTKARSDAARALREKKEAAIRAMLTPEQVVKYENMMKSKKGNGMQQVKEQKVHQE
ncbi:MAG TPA: hypothetical protein PK760_07905 [Flavobacteriales bacterium]|nr:hypothetical protein [Flavobacteriales bacterium]